MVTHHSSLSSQVPPAIVNHSAPNQNEAVPAFNKQLSTKNLLGYPASAQSREDSTMSLFSSPTLELPSHSYAHNHTPSSSQHTSTPPNNDFYPSQNSTQAPNSAYNSNNGISTPVASSVSISSLPLQVSRGELSVDIEAQSTPEIILPRQPVASGYSGHEELNDCHYCFSHYPPTGECKGQ